MHTKIRIPLLAAIAGLVLAVGTSAFTHKISHKAKSGTFYYYTFTGAQTQAGRSDGTKYTSPTTNPLSCASGTENECGVEVIIPDGMSAPANISGLSITYDNTTGFPTGGSSYQANFRKPLH